MTAIPVTFLGCNGEGRDLRYGVVYEPGCGHPHRGEVDRGPCPDCNGSGTIMVEPEPRTLEDMEIEAMEDEGPSDPDRCPCGFTPTDCTPYAGDCLYRRED